MGCAVVGGRDADGVGRDVMMSMPPLKGLLGVRWRSWPFTEPNVGGVSQRITAGRVFVRDGWRAMNALAAYRPNLTFPLLALTRMSTSG